MEGGADISAIDPVVFGVFEHPPPRISVCGVQKQKLQSGQFVVEILEIHQPERTKSHIEF